MSSPSDGPASPLNRKLSRSSKRGRLKNGTFILPGTGERIRRQITLRNPFEGPGRSNSSTSDSPLLSSRRRSSQAQSTGGFNSFALDKWAEFWEWLHTPVAKGIFKCSLAYLLGCMGTFFPPFANFLGHQDGKHMVATITVYFHPSRSAGSMGEATMLGIGAFLYATFIAVSSMAVSVFFESRLGMIELAYAIILIVFCGGGLGFIGWVKQKYGDPLVSVACSLASLAIITVLTKENAVQVGVFEDDKIVQVMKMVIMGIITTSAVSLLVWPVSARTELRESMIKVTDSFGDMLTLITRGFLSGSEADLKSAAFESAQCHYNAVFRQMTKNLKEAKLEHYVLGTEKEFALEMSLVGCMQRLSQSIGGLRSAAMTQFALLQEIQDPSKITLGAGFQSPRTTGGSITSSVWNDRFAVLTAIEEASEESSNDQDETASRNPATTGRQSSNASFASINVPITQTPSQIFSRFMQYLGPSMKSLAYTLSQILEELPFGGGPNYRIAFNSQFKNSLTDALALYSNARVEALQQVYRSKDLDRDRSEDVEADFEEVAASCGHFSFSLLAFARETQNFLIILEDLKEQTEKDNGRSWNWLRFWRTFMATKSQQSNPESEEEHLIEGNNDHPQLPKVPKDDSALDRRDARKWKELRHDSKQSPYRRTLKVLKTFYRDDIRFALKVGAGAALYALFAFIPATRPFYRHWRGEWGLLSYMLVCTITIGASNTTGWSRFLGTFLGAIIAVLVWIICQGNPFALAFCGWLVSLPCFYIIIAKGRGPFGRFIMLTYNLSCLYAYSLSIKDGDDDDDEGGVTPIITDIVLHRVVAVFVGVIWGMIITRVIWPISARHKFKDGLSLLWLRMALLWKRDPLSTLLEGEPLSPYMNLNEEFALQAYMIRLHSLREAAMSEFELRGPFPSQAYARIMESTSKILDLLHAMNLVIQKDPDLTDAEAALLKFTADERAQLCARISHLFQVLASSLKLEYPLNNAVPDASNPRNRLLAKIFQYRKKVLAATDEDYEMLYAYTLVTGQIAAEIKKVEREVDDLYGVIDEDLFELQ